MTSTRVFTGPMLFVALSAALLAQGTPQAPVFHAGTDLVRVDVSVRDKDRLPVRGLTAADFTITEDNVPQKIEAFSAVDLSDTGPPPAPWMRRVSADVATNDVHDRRLFLIVIDDAMLIHWPLAIANTKTIADGVIARMGPGDLAAVVFTRDNRRSQNFTSDPVRLKAAIETTTSGFAFGERPTGTPGAATRPPDPNEYYYRSSISTITNAADLLSSIPDRRKTLVYISIGLPVDFDALGNVNLGSNADPEKREMIMALFEEMQNAFGRAERSNVNVYTFDPAGLDGLEQYFTSGMAKYIPAPSVVFRDYLQAVATGTGGRATLDTNLVETGLTEMFTEAGSYYILGYRQSKPNTPAHFSHLDIHVNRPGLEVLSRHVNYVDKTEADADAAAPPATLAMSGLLPNPGAPLRVTAAPFAAAVPDKAGTETVALVLGLTEPAPAEHVTEHVDLVTRAFTPEGVPKGSDTQTADVTLRAASSPADGVDARYEVLSQIRLVPGRYQLRLAASNTSRDTTGSVFVDVDVPDFAKEPLSLSGVMLHAESAPRSAPEAELIGVVPLAPTAAREFATSDQVAALLRVYQGGKGTVVPTTLVIRITDAHDAVVFSTSEALDAARFGTARAADVRFDLPLARLTPGAHLLSFEATMGKARAARDVVFAAK